MRFYVALPVLLCGCGSDAPEEQFDPPMSTWITESEYEFGGAPEAGIIFQSPLVYADPGRNRILVLDPRSWQVSAWALDGSLSFVVGRRGEGPGEFTSPQALFLETDGSFSVWENNGFRFTTFLANGELVETVLGPTASVDYQGFQISVAWPQDDVHLGVPLVPTHIETGKGHPGLATGSSMTTQPLLRVRRSSDGRWQEPEPLLQLDYRNQSYAMERPELPGGGWRYGAEPFGDADQIKFEPGKAVVLRRNGSPGEVELLEVNGQGDAIWHRRLQFEPKLLTPELIDEWLDQQTRELRRRYDETIYKPEYLPAVERFYLTASGEEVWLRTHEVSDTLRTHYVVARGDGDTVPRRVLLPAGMRIYDATATHVWGMWWDSMDVPYVVGRRLVPLGDR